MSNGAVLMLVLIASLTLVVNADRQNNCSTTTTKSTLRFYFPEVCWAEVLVAENRLVRIFNGAWPDWRFKEGEVDKEGKKRLYCHQFYCELDSWLYCKKKLKLKTPTPKRARNFQHADDDDEGNIDNN